MTMKRIEGVEKEKDHHPIVVIAVEKDTREEEDQSEFVGEMGRR